MRDMNFQKIRIDEWGQLEVVDPGFDSLELITAIDPEYQIKKSELPGYKFPRFKKLKEFSCGLSNKELKTRPFHELWDIHQSLMIFFQADEIISNCKSGEASILDLKIELTYRSLSHCSLCRRNCWVDRTRLEKGFCQLGIEAKWVDCFVHIAEESPINPSLVLTLAGCSLRCRFCQKGILLEPKKIFGKYLKPELWSQMDTRGARSMTFIGGNPDESLYAILNFLKSAPTNWNLPIVWNCHGYENVSTIKLLEGIVDVFIPDFKYGKDACGRKLSLVQKYPETAQKAISAMVEQKVPVFVRILVLPGHFECCHKPVLDFLSSLERNNLFVSLRGQYCPDWQISTKDGEMIRRVTHEEVEAVRYLAERLELKVIK